MKRGFEMCVSVPAGATSFMFESESIPLRTLASNFSFTPNCQNCHGNGLAGMQLASNDPALICLQVMGKLNKADIAQSLIVTKVSGGVAHNGGQVNDAAAWRAVFVNNAAAFF
jgi:hypothetical protein